MKAFKIGDPIDAGGEKFKISEKVFVVIDIEHDGQPTLNLDYCEINDIFYTGSEKEKKFCYEFLPHSIFIKGQEIKIPKRVILEDYLFKTMPELTNSVTSKGWGFRRID